MAVEQALQLEDLDLAYFVQGTAAFDAYIRDMTWAQDYALANVGQAKYLFSFDLTKVTFSTNGTANNVVHALPDWWLMQRGLKPYPTNSTPDTTAPSITVVEPVEGGQL